MFLLELLQQFHRRGNEGMEAEDAHALRDFLRVVTTLEDFLSFFVFRHKGDSGQKVASKTLGAPTGKVYVTTWQCQ
jgi:hypothetical protein